MIDAADADLVPGPKWLVQDRLLAGRIMVIGAPKAGKTWLACWAAARVIDAGGTVVYLAGEDRPADVAGRVASFLPSHAFGYGDLTIGGVEDLPGCALYARRAGATLLVIDPLVRFLRTGETASGPCKRFLGSVWLPGISTLVTHHARKGATCIDDSARGSGELLAWGDTNCFIGNSIELQHRAAPSGTMERPGPAVAPKAIKTISLMPSRDGLRRLIDGINERIP